MTDVTGLCESTEGRYVPWSFGTTYECLACGHRIRLQHDLRKLSGDDYDAVYPIPTHSRGAS